MVPVLLRASLMRGISAAAGAATLLLSTASFISAQAKPDFSGTWTRESGARADGGFACGPSCQITQSENALTLSRQVVAVPKDGSDPVPMTTTWTCTLDGNNCANPAPGRAPVVSQAKWDGSKIIVKTKTGTANREIIVTQILAMEGGKMSVTTSVEAPGMTGVTQMATYTKG